MSLWRQPLPKRMQKPARMACVRYQSHTPVANIQQQSLPKITPSQSAPDISLLCIINKCIQILKDSSSPMYSFVNPPAPNPLYISSSMMNSQSSLKKTQLQCNQNVQHEKKREKASFSFTYGTGYFYKKNDTPEVSEECSPVNTLRADESEVILDGMNSTTTQHEKKTKMQIFNELYCALKENRTIENINDGLMLDLFTCLIDYLTVESSAIPRKYYFYELSTFLTRDNWSEIETLYSIVLLLTTYESQKRKPLLIAKKEFLRKIVFLLKSPDDQELRFVKIVIMKITDLFQESKIIVYGYIIQLLKEYLVDQTLHFCVSPCLTLLNLIFFNDKNFISNCTHNKQSATAANNYNSNITSATTNSIAPNTNRNPLLSFSSPKKVSSKSSNSLISYNNNLNIVNNNIIVNHNELYKIFIKLFIKSHLFIYFSDLHANLIWLYTFNGNYVQDALYFIMRYWPKVSSKNEICFVNHMLIIMKDFINKTVLPQKIIQMVEHRVIRCILNENVNVSIITLRFLAENDALEVFEEINDSFTHELLKILKVVSNSWDDDVRHFAKQTENLIEGKEKTKGKPKINKAIRAKIQMKVNWITLKNMARKNYEGETF